MTKEALEEYKRRFHKAMVQLPLRGLSIHREPASWPSALCSNGQSFERGNALRPIP